MTIIYLFILSLIFNFQCNAQCVCIATSNDCTLLGNTCGGGGCDVIQVESNQFNLTWDCIDQINKGKQPILNFTKKTCSLILESNIFVSEGGLQIEESTIMLSGFVNFESFKVFDMKSSKAILIISGNYETNCSSFRLNRGRIEFSESTSFINSTLLFENSVVVFQNRLYVTNSSVTFENSTLIGDEIDFYGESNCFINNSNIQAYQWENLLFVPRDNSVISFYGKINLLTLVGSWAFDYSKLFFEENTIFTGNGLVLLLVGYNSFVVQKNCTIKLSGLAFTNAAFENFQIFNDLNIEVDELLLVKVTLSDESIKNFKVNSISLGEEATFTIKNNLNYKRISFNETSNLNINNCEVNIENIIFEKEGTLMLNNSLVKTKLIILPQIDKVNNTISLYEKSNIEIDLLNCLNVNQHFYVDSESQLFVKSQQNVANITFDLGNKERTKQVLDIEFEIPQYGNYSFINLPTTQCVDAVYSSISTTQSTTYLSYPDHVILSNKKVLRICSNEINKEFQCVLNGSIWQYSFQTNDFSFETRNCPCGNDGITKCSYLPTTKSLTIPTNSETLLFEGPIQTIYITRNTNIRTLNGTFYNIIMPSSIELKISNETLKKGEPIEYYSTLKCTNDLDYILTNQNTNETITINLNPISSLETSNIYLPFKIVNIEYSNELKYKSAVINSGNVINQITLTTEKGLTTNLHNKVNSVYISKSGIVDEKKSKSCLSIYTNNQGETTCLFNENYWCQSGEYLDSTKTCSKCSNNCERCLNSTYCLLCSNNYTVTTDGSCVESTEKCLVEMGASCVLCENGYYYDEPSCIKCSDNCEICSDVDFCVVCESNYINSNGNCIKPEHSIITNNNTILKCDENYYSNENGECEICSNVIEGCLICESSIKCTKCSDNYVLNSTNQCVSTQCETGYVKNECGQCVNEILNCLKYIKEECVECEVNYHIKDEKCEIEEVLKCSIYSNTIGCSRCSDNYYSKNKMCYKCSNNCKTCSNNPDYCLSCYDGTYLDLETNKCKLNEEMKDKCEIYSPLGNCVKCKEGYYRIGYSCNLCDSKCSYCQDNSTCIVCKSDYFMNYENECQLKSSIVGCENEISTSLGCTKCQDGYYLYHKECYECSSNCKTCSYSSEYCITCSSDKVFMNNECYEISQITKCKEISNNECTKCSFWYSPNEDGTQCDKKAEWWFILIIVLLMIVIIGLIIFGIYKLIVYCLRRKQRKEQEKTICVFEMKRSNVVFTKKICKYVYSNVSLIDFNEDEPEIPVDKETKSLICIGNKGKTKKKIQITLKEGCDKYSIRTNPQVITLTKGEACEFEIFITPLCTCKFEDILNIVILDMKKGETSINQMKIIVETELSSRLDPEELKEDKKLGEGSFGIVYLGTFRGNKVAIKKMKEIQDEEKMKEFTKEVTMLDKFRSEYIIHFYGAVFIPNKICMVTEFAQFGSLQDLMKNQNETFVTMKMRIKMMIDSAKGIQYLHSNGILHRDIKPDNILVMSLDDNIQVNAKLTDFGSSRNINQMMTNMTFTKGIGSPKFMAPEVLGRKKYKMPSDVYSFAITMFECFGWKEIYPKDEFKFPWKIAEFVTSGNRRSFLENIPNELNEIISCSWKQDPKERITIIEIADSLGKCNTTNR